MVGADRAAAACNRLNAQRGALAFPMPMHAINSLAHYAAKWIPAPNAPNAVTYGFVFVRTHTQSRAKQLANTRTEEYVCVCVCTHHPDGRRSRTDSRRSPCGASSAADDGTCARRAATVRPVPVSVVVRAWSCTIVESYWG